ncbi:MAG: hypothetical protein ACE1ZO_07215 [Nitrospirales bacterium]
MGEKQPPAQQSEISEPQKRPVETEILNVNVERKGQEVSAKWGLHPSLKSELTPDEWKELTDVMGKVTDIVGKRFVEVLAREQKEAGGTA